MQRLRGRHWMPRERLGHMEEGLGPQVERKGHSLTKSLPPWGGIRWKMRELLGPRDSVYGRGRGGGRKGGAHELGLCGQGRQARPSQLCNFKAQSPGFIKWQQWGPRHRVFAVTTRAGAGRGMNHAEF